MVEINRNSNDSWVTIRAELKESGDVIDYDLPKDNLVPMIKDDRLKHAIRELAENQKASKWGETYQEAAKSREEYIENVKENPLLYFRRVAARHPDLLLSVNQLAFENHGGILNQGVCWWHSRFQRAMFCLCYCNPDARSPADEEVKSIVWRIMGARNVVELPGFGSFREFSEKYQDQIQSCLESSQIIEGAFLFAWINGLSGKSRVSSEKMQKQMDEIYGEVTGNGLAYVKLQIPGWDAHAWLISEIQVTNTDSNGNNSYEYKFLDSNWLNCPLCWKHNPGDEYIEIGGTNFGVPYLQREWELRRIKRTIKKFVS